VNDREQRVERSETNNDVTRRDMIKTTAGTVVAISGVLDAAAQAKAAFFTAAQLALVDELSEIIIPADDHSPGARAARVASYIDARLAEAADPALQTTWRDGLERVEALSRELNGVGFMDGTRAQREAVVTRISANEPDPKLPEELFFRELKERTVHAYYSSKIGIHQEMEYKGNTLLNEFVGTEAGNEGPK
jgi:Gluconate 2-dehydrogenase subunit 3